MEDMAIDQVPEPKWRIELDQEGLTQVMDLSRDEELMPITEYVAVWRSVSPRVILRIYYYGLEVFKMVSPPDWEGAATLKIVDGINPLLQLIEDANRKVGEETHGKGK